MTAELYIDEVIQAHMVTTMQHSGAVFQLDNVKLHTVRLTRVLQRRNIQVLY